MRVILTNEQIDQITKMARKVTKEISGMSPEELNQKLTNMNFDELINRKMEFDYDGLIKKLKERAENG